REDNISASLGDTPGQSKMDGACVRRFEYYTAQARHHCRKITTPTVRQPREARSSAVPTNPRHVDGRPIPLVSSSNLRQEVQDPCPSHPSYKAAPCLPLVLGHHGTIDTNVVEDTQD